MCRGKSGEGIHMEAAATDGKRQFILYSIFRENEVASSPAVDHYVIIMNVLHFICNMLQYSYCSGKLSYSYEGLFFRKVGYKRYDVQCIDREQLV
jgi:hypothetical protein